LIEVVRGLKRNNACRAAAGDHLRERRKWTKKSTFTSRKSTIASGDDIQTRSALSRASAASKTFDTTAIKPQNPQQSETYIISAENATDKALNGLQPIEQDSATKNFKDARPLRRSAKRSERKRLQRVLELRTGGGEPDDNHFHEKLRHLWTMKRQAQEIQTVQGSNEHSGAASDNRLRRTQQRVPPKFQLALHRAFDDFAPTETILQGWMRVMANVLIEHSPRF
jgi:hypothetical protein